MYVQFIINCFVFVDIVCEIRKFRWKTFLGAVCPAAAALSHKANTRGKTEKLRNIKVAEIHDLMCYHVINFTTVYGRCTLFTPHYYFGKVDTNTRIVYYYRTLYVYVCILYITVCVVTRINWNNYFKGPSLWCERLPILYVYTLHLPRPQTSLTHTHIYT